MSTLRARITTPHNGPDLTEVGIYNTPSEMPNVRIRIVPGGLTYEDLTSLVAPDGRPIAATGQGTWGQLYSAGTP